MIYVSFMELMPESLHLFSEQHAPKLANVYMLLAFFSGIGLIALIDRLVPEDENPHEMHLEDSDLPKKSLKRTGIMMALAIGIHNFPEDWLLCIGTDESGHCAPDCAGHCHSQHSRNCGFRTYLSCYRKSAEGVLVFFPFGDGGTGGCLGGSALPLAFLDTGIECLAAGFRIGYHDLYFLR